MDKKTKKTTKVTRKKATKATRKKVTKTRKEATEMIDDEQKLDIPNTESALTAEEIEEFRLLLLKKRRELVGDVGAMRGESSDGNRLEASGDLSSMPSHMADLGTDNYEQEFTLGLIESERKKLREINAALDKVSKGEYGICEVTGNNINRERLRAKPEAKYCIEYARMLEQGLVTLLKGPLGADEQSRSEQSA